MYQYIKENSSPILIEYVEDEHDETRDFTPSFWWYGKRYYLDDFIRCHNNPWSCGNFPDHIHGYESDNYYNPVYIELIADEAVNVYTGKEIAT